MTRMHKDKLPDAFGVKDVTYLLKKATDSIDDKLVASVEVPSHEQETAALGTYNKKQPPKGFVIEYVPEIEPSSVVCRIVELDGVRPNMIEYKLFLGNFSDKTISAEVREL